MRHLFGTILCAALAFASPAWPQAAGDDRMILGNMAKLKPMIGHWRAAIDYHNRDGSVELRGGDYDIHPVLQDTYLQLDADIYRLNDHAKHHGFMMMTTFNPDTKKFDGTYFYTLWAMRVTEAGVFDDAKQELAVDTFVPKEDGVHDETGACGVEVQPQRHHRILALEPLRQREGAADELPRAADADEGLAAATAYST
jgi:hypothetical protein